MKNLLVKKPQEMTEKQIQNIMNVCLKESRKRKDEKDNKAIGKLVGKSFKYKNSYSCPESEDDYWWLYIYVKAIENGHLITKEFQTDRDGKITIEDNCIRYRSLENYQQCLVDEFDIEFMKVISKINELCTCNVDSRRRL